MSGKVPLESHADAAAGGAPRVGTNPAVAEAGNGGKAGNPAAPPVTGVGEPALTTDKETLPVEPELADAPGVCDVLVAGVLAGGTLAGTD